MSDLATASPANPNVIKEVPLSGIDPRLQKQVESADKAIDKNPGFAVEICTNILVNNPGCLEIRKILRKAQKKATAGKTTSGFTRFLTNSPFGSKANTLLKTDPKGAILEAEKLLSANASNVAALKTLAQAAAALGMHGTAAFSYENIRDIEPNNVDNLVSLGNALIESGQPKEAVAVGERITQLASTSPAGQELVRRATVAISMVKSEQKLADPAKAMQLDQQERAGGPAATPAEALVRRLTAQIAKEPENITAYRELINHYKQASQLEEAITWVRKARQIPLGRTDVSLEKMETDMAVANARSKIEKMEAELAKAPDPVKQVELDRLRKEELEARLVQAKVLVDKYPTDFSFRFDYGSLLLDTGQFDAAIRELQTARRSPKVAHKAMLLLGRAYSAKKIYDLAVEQLQQAENEISMMNDIKKEVIYELGHALRSQGNEDKAVEKFKILYNNDIDYRDVAKIINEYYEKRAKA